MSRDTEIDRRARLRSTLVKAGRAERASDSLRASLLTIAAASAATAASTPVAVAAASSTSKVAIANTGVTKAVTSVAPAATGSTASLATSANGVVAWKVLAVLLAIGALGTGASFFARREAEPVVPAPSELAPASPTPLAQVAPEPVVPAVPTPQEVASISIDELPTVQAPPSARSVPIAAPPALREATAAVPSATVTTPAARLTEETHAIGAIRTSLKRGDTREALRLLDGYDAEFPRGVLAEEAEVLRIETLARAGNGSEAASRANRFLAERPQSPHAGRVQAMLRRLSNPE